MVGSWLSLVLIYLLADFFLHAQLFTVCSEFFFQKVLKIQKCILVLEEQ